MALAANTRQAPEPSMASTRTISVFEPSPSGSAAARLLTGQHRGNSAPTIEPERRGAITGAEPETSLVDT